MRAFLLVLLLPFSTAEDPRRRRLDHTGVSDHADHADHNHTTMPPMTPDVVRPLSDWLEVQGTTQAPLYPPVPNYGGFWDVPATMYCVIDYAAVADAHHLEATKDKHSAVPTAAPTTPKKKKKNDDDDADEDEGRRLTHLDFSYSYDEESDHGGHNHSSHSHAVTMGAVYEYFIKNGSVLVEVQATTEHAMAFCQDSEALEASDMDYAATPTIFGHLVHDVIHHGAMACVGTSTFSMLMDVPDSGADLPDYASVGANLGAYEGASFAVDFHSDCGDQHLHVTHAFRVDNGEKVYSDYYMILEANTTTNHTHHHHHHHL